METDVIYYAIISIVVSAAFFMMVKFFMSRKLADLKGTQKLLGLISVIIIGLELVFLGMLFDLFTIAASVIASAGVAFALVSFALQNHLKNMVSGIGLYLNKRIDIGDILEIDGTVREIDSAFNHQLWFASTASLLNGTRHNEVIIRVDEEPDIACSFFCSMAEDIIKGE